MYSNTLLANRTKTTVNNATSHSEKATFVTATDFFLSDIFSDISDIGAPYQYGIFDIPLILIRVLGFMIGE